MTGVSSQSRQAALPAWILIIGISLAIIGALWSWGDHVAASVVGLATVMGISGYRMGAAKGVAMAGGIPLACHYAPTVATWVESLWSHFLGGPDLSGRVGIFLLVGISIVIGVALLAYILFKYLVEDRPFMEATNRWLGCGLAAAYSLMLALFFLGGLLVVERTVARQAPGGVRRTPGTMQQHLLDKLLETAKKTRKSAVGPLVEDWNPFDHVPLLAQLEQSITGPSNPFSARTQMAHSTRADELLRDVLGASGPHARRSSMWDSRQHFDESMVRALMSSHAVRELFEKPRSTSQ
jgi:hypothetical protein